MTSALAQRERLDSTITEIIAHGKTVYFLGINGIGLSALAQYFKHKGVTVKGSCDSDSVIVQMLMEKDIEVIIGHDAMHVTDIADEIGCVFYTVAITEDNPELIAIKELGIPLHTYAEGLGHISRIVTGRGGTTIAVAGSHGKTTTTAMIAGIMAAADRKPTVIVGSLLIAPNDGINGKGAIASNFIPGDDSVNGGCFIVEACEFKESFLELSPTISVITNIDNDHLDYYKTMENLIDAFISFAKNTSHAIVTHPNLPHIFDLIAALTPRLDEASPRSTPRIFDADMQDVDFEMRIPGAHVVANAQCALAVADLMHVDPVIARKSLTEFRGTWRRSQFKGKMHGKDGHDGAEIYDDYAHHPTEIATTLKGFKERYADKKITVLFQPHLYSRTKFLFDEFVEALSNADAVWYAPIYAAREVHDPTISSEALVEASQKRGTDAHLFAGDLAVFGDLGDKDILITMGAGDIYKQGEKLLV